MQWRDLLFAHWPVDTAALRPLIPAALDIDTHEGQAWLGVVPFRMTGVTLAGWPAVPGVSSFPELNLRTYVRHQGRPGVWFFSLDATHAIAVRVARRTFRLPYFDARISVKERDGEFEYRSKRTHRGAPAGGLAVRYRPTGEAREAARGSLEHWQIERYCLYAAAPDGRILRGDVEHAPWQLQAAEAEFSENTLAAGFGLSTPGPPATLAFARRTDVVARWPVDDGTAVRT